MLQFPPLLDVVVPRDVAPSKSSTGVLAGAMPVAVRVLVLFVMLSELEIPEPSPPCKLGDVGPPGGPVSIVTLNVPDGVETLPAASVAAAVMLCVPSAMLFAAVMVHVPPLVTKVPLATPSTSKVTVVPFSVSVPVKLGFLTLVMLSVFELPLSLASVISGVEGGSGTMLSTVIELLVL